MSGSRVIIITTFNIYEKTCKHKNSPKNSPLATPHPRSENAITVPAVGPAKPGAMGIRGQRARFEAEHLSYRLKA